MLVERVAGVVARVAGEEVEGVGEEVEGWGEVGLAAPVGRGEAGGWEVDREEKGVEEEMAGGCKGAEAARTDCLRHWTGRPLLGRKTGM